MTRRALVALTLVAGVACARDRPPDFIGEPGPEAASGTVRRVGNVPFTRTLVENEDRHAVAVVGPLEPELRRLVGAEVAVSGAYETEPSGPDGRPALIVSGYSIEGVDGERPLVGTLVEEGEEFFLEMPGDRRQRLVAVLGVLAQKAGARVWVVLDENDGVARYGVIREPE